MRTMFSPFRSATLSLTQNRYATSQASTATNQTSLLRGNLKTDKVEINPHFSGKTTYKKYGTITANGEPCYWQYKNGKLQEDAGPFQRVSVLDGKPGETKMVKISDGDVTYPEAITTDFMPPPPPKK